MLTVRQTLFFSNMEDPDVFLVGHVRHFFLNGCPFPLQLTQVQISESLVPCRQEALVVVDADKSFEK